MKLLAEITLALVLFGDASSVDLARLRRDAGPVARLLVSGLLLTIVFGTVVALGLFPGITPRSCPAHRGVARANRRRAGAAGHHGPNVPSRIRRILNVESGLNDGIATPFVLLRAGARHRRGDRLRTRGSSTPCRRAAWVSVAGVVVGAVGGWLLVVADRRELDISGVSAACGAGALGGLVPCRARRSAATGSSPRSSAGSRSASPAADAPRTPLLFTEAAGLLARDRRVDDLRRRGRRRRSSHAGSTCAPIPMPSSA